MLLFPCFHFLLPTFSLRFFASDFFSSDFLLPFSASDIFCFRFLLLIFCFLYFLLPIPTLPTVPISSLFSYLLICTSGVLFSPRSIFILIKKIVYI
uniref:Uncharacterized protein n=1 Tax=Meloidogyne enterolobii TaxID=390850 RepID=A0A6V7V4M4_MELEN|nr:unnamed protein product [Meloidogyne enterolobii]